MYLVRESKISLSNPHYKPNGEYNTFSPTDDRQIPNCTVYALLRAYEAIGKKVKGIASKNSYGFGNAKNWWDNSGMEKLSQPVDGCIAVFDGNCGHVAFVERVIDSTHAVITESSYHQNKDLRNKYFWNKQEAELIVGKATLSGVGKLLGFLKIPVDDIRVNPDPNKKQITATQTYHSVRINPSKTSNHVQDGCYLLPGTYDVLETTEAEGYTWCRIADNCWVAVCDDIVLSGSDPDIVAMLNECIAMLEKIRSQYGNS